MPTSIIEIIICLGSSCFARGNKKTLSRIQQYISDHELEESVKFRGNHCFGKCKDGPVLKINGREYKGVDESGIIEILEKELGQIKK
ncbi:MAG: (2Fe-2S) ferredoxin domain-containing protein [Bacteroidota bacterium]